MSTSNSPDSAPAEFTITDVGIALLRQWRLMLAVALAVPVVAAAVLWHQGWVYRASATLQTPDVSLSDFKRYAIALADREAFQRFAKSSNLLSADEIDRVGRAMPRDGGVGRWVAAAFAIRKGDVRDIPDSARQESQFFGADIEFEDRDGRFAERVARAVGEFVADAIVAGRVNDFRRKGLAEATTELGRVELERLEQDFQLSQLHTKLGELGDIDRRYPAAGKQSGPQVVLVDKSGENFLPPVVQLVGVESLLADTREKLRDLNRKRERFSADRALFTAAEEAMKGAITGTEKVAAFEKAVASTFAVTPPANSGALESLAQATARIAEIKVLRDQGLRYVSEPVVTAPSLRRFATMLSVAVVGGLLLAGFVALLVAWWRSVRDRFQAGR